MNVILAANFYLAGGGDAAAALDMLAGRQQPPGTSAEIRQRVEPHPQTQRVVFRDFSLLVAHRDRHGIQSGLAKLSSWPSGSRTWKYRSPQAASAGGEECG